MYVGADEAGKGPVLGPMVAGAVRADPADLPDDVDDSKKLSPARREAVDAALREHPAVRVAVAVVPVARIDDPETDMNRLGVAGQAEAVAAVAEAGDRVVADAADTSESRFGNRLADAVADGPDSHAGVEVSVTAEHGADESDPVVAAASVVAKVERDRIVADIDADHDRDVGSGYPSDPATRAFLREYVAEHGELPACARASWSTSQDVLTKASQSALDEF